MLPRVLSIAGSDSGGGAGIQADLKTFTVLRVYGMTAVTALTAQNTKGVAGIFPVAPEFVRLQIDAVVRDLGIDAAKTGMLANRGIIEAVCAAVRDHRIERLVVDPVLVATSGAKLLDSDARGTLLRGLIPLAAVVTPNAPEAAALLNIEVSSLNQMHDAARRLVDAGARAALVKGGHIGGPAAVDVLHFGTQRYELRSPRVETRHTHGTGCMMAAALAAGLAEGRDVVAAAIRAKHFVTVAVVNGLALGAGNGPANPLAWLEEETLSLAPQVSKWEEMNA
jgi:hydroxymethylpyrimidine/phosphomethylpyrimidine kinase